MNAGGIEHILQDHTATKEAREAMNDHFLDIWEGEGISEQCPVSDTSDLHLLSLSVMSFQATALSDGPDAIALHVWWDCEPDRIIREDKRFEWLSVSGLQQSNDSCTNSLI